jgi:hypothetical protein
MNIDGEILKHLPKSFQIWQQIEEEAQRRAEHRFEEILNHQKKAAEYVVPNSPTANKSRPKSDQVEVISPPKLKR